MTKAFDWKWDLEERMTLHAWLKQQYELLVRKEGQTQSVAVKTQCQKVRPTVVYFMQYANMKAVVRREQQTMIGMDIERIVHMHDGSARERWVLEVALLSVINGLTG